MFSLKRLKNFSLFRKKRNWFKDYPETRIVHAFTAGGIDYYEFEDPNNLTQGRGFSALNYYKELSMSCTREYLQGYVEAMDNYLRPKSNGKLEIPEMAKLTLQLKERLEMVVDSLTPYKVAAVMYFDDTEDPYGFDYSYALKKIERWKKEDVGSFFLQTPLKNLIPSTLWSEETLQSYMKVAQEMDKEHIKSILDAISQQSSMNPKRSELLKVLNLEKNLI